MAAVLALATGSASAALAAPTGATPTVPGAVAVAPATTPVPVAYLTPAPADLVRQTGSWYRHGRTLDLRADGTGTFATWVGALDGTLLRLRLVPAPGPAAVAEVTAVETVGAGALAPAEEPGVGGLVTMTFGAPVRTAHVEWTAGPTRHAEDLCPAEGLDADQMAALRCGA